MIGSDVMISFWSSKAIDSIKDELVLVCLCDQPAALSDSFLGALVKTVNPRNTGDRRGGGDVPSESNPVANEPLWALSWESQPQAEKKQGYGW